MSSVRTRQHKSDSELKKRVRELENEVDQLKEKIRNDSAYYCEIEAQNNDKDRELFTIKAELDELCMKSSEILNKYHDSLKKIELMKNEFSNLQSDYDDIKVELANVKVFACSFCGRRFA